MEKKLGRLIISFFIIMLCFTMVSRIAASIMVPKVGIATAREGNLFHEVNGTGTIKEDAKKYIELTSGYRIDQIYIKEGQMVEKGEILFQYDLEPLLEKKNSLTKELEKLQLSYEKTELGKEKENSIEGADLKTEEAVKNKMLATEKKKRAQEDRELAKESLKKAKQKLITEKQEEYEKAVSELERLLDEKENALTAAQRKLEDTYHELESLKKPKTKIMERLADYKAALERNEEKQIANAYFAIFDLFYSGTYEEHQRIVEEKKEKLRRAEEDLKEIRMGWIYYTDQVALEKEEKNANRNIADIQKELEALTKKDKELEQAIDVYKGSILKIEKWDEADAEYLLYQVIYKELKIDEDKISLAQTNHTRAEADQEQIENEWEKKESEAQKKVDELYLQLTDMQQSNYDWQEQLANNENALRAAQRELEDSIYTEEKADRELEAAELDLKKTSNNLIENNQSVELELQALTMDMEDKQVSIDKIEGLLEEKGRVKSPVSGVILSLTLEPGTILTGQEKLIISTGDYELEMKANKEELKNFAIGDEFSIKKEEYSRVTAQIEHIGLPDQDGNVTFTAILPVDSSYRVGGGLEFELNKSSKSYSRCIPIQAIRQDTNSKFILVIRETNGILGKIQIAFRLDVTILAQDAKSVAIEAPLSQEDEIIISSSKNISEGDRVRVVETK